MVTQEEAIASLDWLQEIPGTMSWQSHTSGLLVPVAVQLGTSTWSGGCGPSELMVLDAELWSSHCIHDGRDPEPGTASTVSSHSDSTSEYTLSMWQEMLQTRVAWYLSELMWD